MTSHEALRRSRQVFWSVVVGMIVSTIPGTIASTALTALLPVGAAASELVFVIQAIVTTIFLVPFVYTTSGIVLGGVDVVEALKRSFGMARIRWRLAFVAALARTLAQTLLAFGLSAGLDILSRGASGLGLGLDGGAVQTFVTIIVVAMGVVAFGSLLATIAAISVAPEVVAFVGLTHYAGGLDGARDGATGAPPPPWVSRPMLVGIATALFFSLIGASAAASIAAF